MDVKHEWLRHAVATVAYRAGKALRGAPASFAGFRPGPASRTPAQILAHMSDLFDWALSIATGQERWATSSSLVWDDEVARFFHKLEAFDAHLASGNALAGSPERLFQGPIADALTHIGQLTMMRRLAEAPVKGENYFKADIAVGRVGTAQQPAAREFD